MKPLSFKDFNKEVRDDLGTVILYFTAPWDTPGLKTASFLRSTNLEIKIFSVDYDTERELVSQFSIRELPSIYCLKNGQVNSFAYSCETEAELKTLLK